MDPSAARVLCEKLVLQVMLDKPHIQQLHKELNPEGMQMLCTYSAGESRLLGVEISPVQARGYVYQICIAMHMAQLEGWCHGDLHPGNIVVNDKYVFFIFKSIIKFPLIIC